MENQISENNSQFLYKALTSNITVKEFEDLTPDLRFDGENAKTWQLIILKSFDPDFSYLQPLAHHLLDHKYCIVDANMVKYAALNGYKIEIGLAAMQKPLDEVNKFTQDCGFEEKLIVVNKPAEAIIALAKKIVSRSNDNDYNEVKDILEKAGVDVSQSKLMHRPNVAKTLKV